MKKKNEIIISAEDAMRLVEIYDAISKKIDTISNKDLRKSMRPMKLSERFRLLGPVVDAQFGIFTSKTFPLAVHSMETALPALIKAYGEDELVKALPIASAREQSIIDILRSLNGNGIADLCEKTKGLPVDETPDVARGRIAFTGPNIRCQPL